MSKACTKCKLVKELTLFGLDNRRADGRQARCKSCAAEKQALRMQDPDYKAKKLARQSESHAARMQDSEYAAKRKSRIRQYVAARSAEHNATARTRHIKLVGHPNQARPAWVDQEFAALVFSEAYRLAERRKEITGFDWHVDHIIPLKGKLVSGLHVPTNIQVIPAVMNVRKHNSFVVA